MRPFGEGSARGRGGERSARGRGGERSARGRGGELGIDLPARYRVALLAYPACYRATRGTELAATLADGDDERGRPSVHEAASLAYRGLVLRARTLGTPGGLLTAAAATTLVAMFGGFAWVERHYMFRGEVGVVSMEGPERWWSFALTLCAVLIAGGRALRVFDSGRWTAVLRRAVAVAALPPLIGYVGAGEFLHWLFRDPASIPDFLEWRGRILVGVDSTWRAFGELTAAGTAGILIARRLLVRRPHETRHAMLGVLMAALGAVVIVEAWTRPEIVPIRRSFTDGYAQSAFADLETGAFVAMAGLLLALVAGAAALWRRRGWDSNPRGT